MDRPASRSSLWSYLLAGPLLLGMSFAATGVVQAQTSGKEDRLTRNAEPPRPVAEDWTPPPELPGKQNSLGKSPARLIANRYAGPSERHQRRASRQRAMGDSRPIGGIVTWPLPPALIIRHTPQVHDEIEGLLGLLRR